MTETKFRQTPPWIVACQVASVAAIWIFVVGISVWIIHLMRLSQALHDVPSASVGISIVAIPVFLTGASVLTYVFVGLRRGASSAADSTDRKEEGPGPE